MPEATVAVVRTSPDTVLQDYRRVMHLACYQDFLKRDSPVALKVNISWHYFYPACSTPPWQLEGVIRTLLEDGYKRESIYAAQNRTVVVSAYKGEANNRHKKVIQKYRIGNVHLYEKGEEWIRYEPKGKIDVLHTIFPRGLCIPKRLIGSSVIHLPTMKTHVFTTMTGAMKNAFGGLINEKRHWTHSVIHETLVDLLTIQKEIHPGIFAVMDATVAGDGPGPRCMRPHVKNYILASGDCVAIDAVAAKMMGFDPLSIKFIRLAHEKGLGCGDLKSIEIVGEDISGVNFKFSGAENTLASHGQKAIYWGFLKPFEKLLLRTFITPWSYLASFIYHDCYWYQFIGRDRVKKFFSTEWGELFKKYSR
jgi:uncharacterized protein (DUF362 family)